MSSHDCGLRSSVHGSLLRWFLPIELLCAGGFLASVAAGNLGLGMGFLVGPVPLLAWAAALQDEYYALAFFAALLPLAGMELLPYHFHHYLYYAMTVVLLVTVSLTRFLSPTVGPRTRLGLRDGIPLSLVGAGVLASSVNAVAHGWTSQYQWFQVVLFIEALALFYFFAVMPKTTNQVRSIVLVFGAMLGLVVLVTANLPKPVGEGGVLGGKIVVTPFGESNLNVFGTFLSSGAVLLLGLTFETEKPSERLFLLVIVAVSLVLLVFTKSRGAWLGFGVAAVYVLLSVRKFWLWSVVAMMAAMMLQLGQLRQVLFVRVGETSAFDPSFLGRMLLWSYAWKVGSANWLLGVGFDNFRAVKHVYGFPEPLSYAIKYHAHNLFLEMFVDVGVLGFAGFCWVFFGTVGRLHVLSRRRDQGWGLALGLCAALIAYGAHGLFDFVAFQYGALALLCVLLGLGVSVVRLSHAATGAHSPRP